MSRFFIGVTIGIMFSLFLTACGAKINTTPQGTTTALGEELTTHSSGTATEQMLAKIKTGSVITIPETTLSVKLTNDQTNFEDTNTNIRGNVIFVPVATSISPTDVATILAITKEGDHQKFYLTSFKPGEDSWQATSMIQLGEAVTLRSLSTSASGIVTASYLQRKPNQPVTEKPKVPMTRTFSYQNDKLVEMGTQM